MADRSDFEDEPLTLDKGVNDLVLMIVCVQNNTTKTKIRDGYQYFGDERTGFEDSKLSLEVIELLDDGIVIEMPPKICSEKHVLQVEIEVKGGGRNASGVFTGKVTSAQKTPTQRVVVEIKFVKIAKEEWNKLLKIYTSRQEEIDDFLKASKG